jgi:outer membrane protein TolC
MCVIRLKKYVVIFLLFLVPVKLTANELTLAEAEQLALDSDFITKEFIARSESLSERAIADRQLPDPKLKLGIMNLPISSFDRSQENMTQLQFGVQQKFPRGRTLLYKSQQTLDIADVEAAKAKNQEKMVLRAVRISYLDLYLQLHIKTILDKNRELFTQLLDITQRQYAVGRDNQHDVLRVQLELSLIDDRITEAEGTREVVIAELAKWIREKNATKSLDAQFPELNALPGLGVIVDELPNHPLVIAEDAVVDANEKNINIAEEQYKPGWMIDLTYGARSGNNLNGSSRDDFASAMILMDIPLFTDKRQDRKLAASKLQHIAAKYARSDLLLDLKRQVEGEHALWSRLGERYELYQQRTIIDASQNSESTLKAYQNDITDITTLMRARLTELDTQLNMLKIRINQAKSHAKLLFFVGEGL